MKNNEKMLNIKDQKKIYGDMYIYLNEFDDIIRKFKCFSNQCQMRLRNILRSKSIIVINGIWTGIIFSIQFWNINDSRIYNALVITGNITAFSITLFVIFTFNAPLLCQTFKKFNTWYKIINYIQYQIASIVLFIHNEIRKDRLVSSFFAHITILIVFIAIIIPQKKNAIIYKSAFIGMIGVLGYYFYLVYTLNDYIVTLLCFNNQPISMKRLGLSSLYNLLAFTMLQCYISFSDKCSVVAIRANEFYDDRRNTIQNHSSRPNTWDHIQLYTLKLSHQIIQQSSQFNIFLNNTDNIVAICGCIRFSKILQSPLFSIILLIYGSSVHLTVNLRLANIIVHNYVIIGSNIVFTTLLLLYIGSFNRQMMIESMKKFTFWFQAINCIGYRIGYKILYDNSIQFQQNTTYLHFVNVNYFLCVFVLIGGYHGLNINKKYKILIVIFMIVLFMAQFCRIFFDPNFTHDMTILSINISLRGIALTSLYNFIAFSLLQLYHLITSNKSNIIYIKPKMMHYPLIESDKHHLLFNQRNGTIITELSEMNNYGVI